MTNVQRHSSGLSFVAIPLAVLALLFGIFSIVWLRSEVRTAEYSLAGFEEQRMEILKERKKLMAERAGLLSIQNVKKTGDEKFGMVFPDRIKVIYVKKDKGTMPYKASFTGDDGGR